MQWALQHFFKSFRMETSERKTDQIHRINIFLLTFQFDQQALKRKVQKLRNPLKSRLRRLLKFKIQQKIQRLTMILTRTNQTLKHWKMILRNLMSKILV